MKLISVLFLLAALPALSQFTGFKSITRFDNTRPAVAEQSDKQHGRIIQINIWYPAEKADARLTFSYYVGLAGLELDSAKNKEWNCLGVNRYFAWPESVNADKRTFLDFLDKKVPMKASLDAKRAQTKYPLIMLVHGYAADYAYLAETLAGKGFVVMQIPVKGTLKTELDYQENGLESQVLDYEYGLKMLHAEFPMLNEEIGVAGFSFGGQSAVALALRNNNVKAVVSLDGGIGSAFGAQLLQAQPYYNVKKLNQPILHLYNARDENADITWIETAPNSKRWLVAMKNMEHGHFTSFGMINKWLPGIMGKDTPDPGRGYETVIGLSIEFFTRIIKNKTNADKNFMRDVLKEEWMKYTVEKHEFIS